MKTGDYFASKYLKAKDLDGPKVVAIAEVTDEIFRGSPEPKPLCRFKGMSKPLILNKTTTEAIEDIAGTDEMDDWTGVKVEIYPTTTEVNGETKACIRIRAPAQAELPTRRAAKPAKPRGNGGNGDMDDETRIWDGNARAHYRAHTRFSRRARFSLHRPGQKTGV